MRNTTIESPGNAALLKISSTESASETPFVGARLRDLRQLHQLSQRELARRSGVTNGMISLIEQNKSSPSVSLLKKVLAGLPMSMAEFFSSVDPRGDTPVSVGSDDLSAPRPGHGIFQPVIAPEHLSIHDETGRAEYTKVFCPFSLLS